MNIVILTVGSRGDIQPFVALGKGLSAAGHTVTLSAPALFEDLATEHGLGFAPINDELLNLKDTEEVQKAMGGKGASLSLIKKVMPLLREMLNDAWRGAQGADALVYHPKSLAGVHIADALKIPAFMSIPLPAYTPTGEFPNPIIPIGGNAWLNRASYNLITLLSIPYMGMINTWRRELLCLPPRPRFKNELVRDDNTRTTVLYPFSEHVVPRPADWDASAHITGYWFLEQTWQPPADLVRFLEAGDAPVYVGFGSMVGTDAEEKGRIVLEALRRSGQRGVIASGWGGLKLQNVPDNVFLLKEAPHDWLFPRMAAVVHHGGAGTTAAGLRAGVPTVICPFMGDQPFWGRRVESLGVGVAPIPQKKLNADNLTEAIQRVVQSTEIRRNAAELGARIRAEDGVGNAVSIISRILSGSQSREPMLAAL